MVHIPNAPVIKYSFSPYGVNIVMYRMWRNICFFCLSRMALNGNFKKTALGFISSCRVFDDQTKHIRARSRMTPNTGSR